MATGEGQGLTVNQLVALAAQRDQMANQAERLEAQMRADTQRDRDRRSQHNRQNGIWIRGLDGKMYEQRPWAELLAEEPHRKPTYSPDIPRDKWERKTSAQIGRTLGLPYEPSERQRADKAMSARDRAYADAALRERDRQYVRPVYPVGAEAARRGRGQR